MKYKNYVGQIEYDDAANIFHGEIVGINDVITFQGTNVVELEQALKESVEDYITWCTEKGEALERP